MAAVNADASISDVVDLVSRGRHTSLPVYRGELDDIVGIMLVPDLVRALASPPVNFSAAAIAREAM
jgi:Mg2+/Co2+ transporter CorB